MVTVTCTSLARDAHGTEAESSVSRHINSTRIALISKTSGFGISSQTKHIHAANWSDDEPMNIRNSAQPGYGLPVYRNSPRRSDKLRRSFLFIVSFLSPASLSG